MATTTGTVLGKIATVAACWALFIGFVWLVYGNRFADPAEKAAALGLETRKAAVEACIETRYRILPGLLPSPLVKAQIEADCATQEARRGRLLP